MDKEIWKDIEGYDGFYRISNYGRVMSCRSWGFGNGRRRKWQFLKPHNRYKGKQYKSVCLFKNHEREYISIHRLVALHFLPRIEGKDVVNHLDENPANNHVSNLEWTTHKGNMMYSHIPEKSIKARIRANIVLTKDGKRIKVSKSLKETADFLGTTISAVKNCCKGYAKTCKGYKIYYIA